jgi:glyoxylate/hydroxypyruvate reductase A
MQVLVDLPFENAADWLAELRRQAPGVRFHLWPEVPEPAAIEVALVWTPDAALFEGLSGLQAIVVPGAGVDQLWRGGAVLPEVPIARLADPVMARRMAEYVLAMVLDHHRGFRCYRAQQAGRQWQRHFHADPAAIGVGIMGLGVMGRAVAALLSEVGYRVLGWSRRPKALDRMRCFAGEEGLGDFLAASEVLVCLLPLTAATRGILCRRTFEALPEGALLINVARGGHLIEADLLAALARGRLRGAVLDVFEDEPLPPDSPLWAHPRITLTPHIASHSNPKTGVAQIVQALQAIDRGEAPPPPVDPTSGY